MTPKQKELLSLLRDSGGMFVRGTQVRVARALEAQGVATLEDNGEMKDVFRRVDDERWWLKLVLEEMDR